MAETEAPIAPATPKKTKAASKPRKPKTAPSHPKVSEMVTSAIGSLKEKGGSSLQAIKKYISSHYKVDIERISPFIRKYLKTAVASGNLVQTKGKGASGSFRIKGDKPVKVPAATLKKPKAVVKKPKAKKSPKKPAAAKKAKVSPKKTKTAKPKAVKPKRAMVPAKKSARARK